MLEIKQLVKKYNTGDLAINGVDLKVENGQVMALIGPSGAGKSTLIRCVNRLENPTSGEIWLNGENIVKMRSGKLRRARRNMGMIFQEYALVERLTVMENVLSGRLGYVGFWRSFLRKFPQSDINAAFGLLEKVGLDTMVNKRADELSGGQRQRIAIARAIYKHASLLLFDEATSALDNKSEKRIQDAIDKYSQDKITITIAHRLSTVKHADKILVFKKGMIVDSGTHIELIQNSSEYKRLTGVLA